MMNYNRYRSPQQYYIKPDVPVVYVPAVHLNSFRVVDIASAAGLPHAGDARKDGVVFFDVFSVSGNFGLYNRSWPYQ